jgi:molybdate transport system substrate-binding protein
MKTRWFLVATLHCAAALADQAQVAVAANFAVPARQLAAQFGVESGHKLVLSNGSTGKFYAQIKSGAPFDVLLSADAETPRRLEAEKLAVRGSRFTYAVGRLVLWRSGSQPVNEALLREQNFTRLAIANPKLAPYGAAARETLEKLGLWEAVQPKLVQGENIAQTFQFVASANADVGLVALAQIDRSAPHWVVPQTLHTPLFQDAVLTARGAGNAAARGFLDFLKSASTRERIRSYGYE